MTGPWVNVCTVPTSQCVYDWSRVTVCTVPTSQCVYDLSLGYCVYGPHFPVCVVYEGGVPGLLCV